MIPKFKKPKPTKEDQPKEKQTKLHPMYKKHMRAIPTDSSAMKQLDLDKLSRDCVLAHEKLTILGWRRPGKLKRCRYIFLLSSVGRALGC